MVVSESPMAGTSLRMPLMSPLAMVVHVRHHVDDARRIDRTDLRHVAWRQWSERRFLRSVLYVTYVPTMSIERREQTL